MKHEEVLSTFIPFAQAVLDFAIMLPSKQEDWRVPERIEKVYLPVSKKLMMHTEYTADSWAKEFEASLGKASLYSVFAEDLLALYLMIKEDNSQDFCGPLRVPFILSQIAGLPYDPT